MPNLTIQQGYGSGTVIIAASMLGDGSGFLDGGLGLFSVAENTNTGIFEFTLATPLPQCIFCVPGVQSTDAAPTACTAQWDYDASTGVLTVYTAVADVLTDPPATDRVGFIAVFKTKNT